MAQVHELEDGDRFSLVPQGRAYTFVRYDALAYRVHYLDDGREFTALMRPEREVFRVFRGVLARLLSR